MILAHRDRALSRVVVFCFTFMGVLQVQDAMAARPLELNDVLSSVDQSYPLVNAASHDQTRARADLLAAKGGFDTTLKAQLQNAPSGQYENRYIDMVLEQPTPIWGARLFTGYRRGSGNFAVYDGRLLTNDLGEIRGGLEVPILRGGIIDERRARIQSSDKAVEGSQQALSSQRLEARRFATYRYYEWLATIERKHIAESLLKLALERDRVMRQRTAAGDAAEVEKIDNRRSVLSREAFVVAAERSIEKAALELSLFYRDAHGQPVLVQTSDAPVGSWLDVGHAVVHLPDFKMLSETVILTHPELLRLQAQLAQNEVDQRLNRNAILPKLDAEFLVAQDWGTGSSGKAMREYKAALKLDFPLFFRTGRGRAESAAAQGQRLEAVLNLTRERLMVGLNDSRQALEASYKRILLAEDEVRLARKVESAERLKFKHGDSNILMVNLREQATADAQLRTIEAITDFYRAQADFTATLGKL